MAGIRARADSLVTIFDHRKNIIRVPNLVVRIVAPAAMLVNAHPDIEFLDELFDHIELVHALGRDTIKSQLLRELKNLTPFLFIRRAHDSVVDGDNMVLRQFVLHLLDHVIRRVMIPFHIRFLGAELLAGIEFDGFSSRLRRFLNSFENAEAIERVCLASKPKTADLCFVWNTGAEKMMWESSEEGQRKGCGPTEMECAHKWCFVLLVCHNRKPMSFATLRERFRRS